MCPAPPKELGTLKEQEVHQLPIWYEGFFFLSPPSRCFAHVQERDFLDAEKGMHV